MGMLGNCALLNFIPASLHMLAAIDGDIRPRDKRGIFPARVGNRACNLLGL